jgi:hypothetical protein
MFYEGFLLHRPCRRPKRVTDTASRASYGQRRNSDELTVFHAHRFSEGVQQDGTDKVYP